MSKQWYVHKDGQQRGPFSFEQLVEETNVGKLGPADMVWSEGMEGWIRAEQVEGLNPVARHHPGPAAPQPAPVSRSSQVPAGELKLEQLSKWMGFVGIMTIIGGTLSAISGVFAFVVGAIPGIITIILGVMLRKAKGHAEAMLYEDSVKNYSANFSMLVSNLNTYFKILGVLIIISLILGVLLAVFGLIAGFAFTNFLGQFIDSIPNGF